MHAAEVHLFLFYIEFHHMIKLQFIQSTLDGLFHCLQFRVIINNASVNIFVFWCTYVHFSCFHTRNGIAGSWSIFVWSALVDITKQLRTFTAWDNSLWRKTTVNISDMVMVPTREFMLEGNSTNMKTENPIIMHVQRLLATAQTVI